MKLPKGSKYLVLLAFILVLGMFAVSSYIAMGHMQSIAEQIDHSVSRNNAKTEYVSEMYEAARTRILALYSMFLNEDPFTRNDAYEYFYNQAGLFINARENYEKLGLSEYEQKELKAAIESIAKGAYPAQAKASDLLLRDEDYAEASRLMLEEAVPAQDKALGHLKQLVQYQRRSSEEMAEAVRDKYTKTRFFIITLGSLTVFFGLLVTVYVVARIGTTETDLTAAMKSAQERSTELSEAMHELKSAQDELVHSEKMVALGQLIAGVAHEINTPLGAIRSSVGNISKFLENHLHHLPGVFQLDKHHLEQALVLLEKVVADNDAPLLSSKEERKLRRALTRSLEENGVEKADTQATRLIEIGVMEADDTILNLLRSSDGIQVLDLVHRLAGINRGLRTIDTASERAGKVVFALKKFAHYDHVGEKQSGDVIESIETVLTLYHNQLKHGIDLTKEYGEVPSILCYPDELNQVWTNLLHNALQAMEYKGSLKIAVAKEDKDVVVRITDSGGGIPPEVQEKIFKPFFTTKPPGEGSGLGLDIVKKIVEKHQGGIDVTSHPGETTFQIRLPIESSTADTQTEEKEHA